MRKGEYYENERIYCTSSAHQLLRYGEADESQFSL